MLCEVTGEEAGGDGGMVAASLDGTKTAVLAVLGGMVRREPARTRLLLTLEATALLLPEVLAATGLEEVPVPILLPSSLAALS